ncbi:MAG: trypsin-like peptidase domain-containing protein [Planctomycetota bacterium]
MSDADGTGAPHDDLAARREMVTGPTDTPIRRDGSSVYELRYERISPPEAASPEPGNSEVSNSQAAKPANPSRRRNDPITQSLGMLATMTVLLLATRFFVPSIVEEIRYAWHRGELRAEYESGTEGLRNVSLESLSDAYEMVTATVGPSVVHIEVKRRAIIEQSELRSLLSPRLPLPSDQGSGVVIDKSGYILTNRHVIVDGEDIMVTLSDGRRRTALLVGSDRLTDLAVLKVDADDLIPIEWGNSDRARVGSPVWAVGSPFGLDRTVTFGILSGKHRRVRASTEWQDFMQSDVAVNPGNSGGPLVDARGTLIGINTAIVGDTYQGVSFSVPSNVARDVFERIRETGHVERGWLGVSLADLSDSEILGDDARLRGAKILSMPDPDSPAAVAGVRVGDVVRTVDDVSVRDMSHLMQLIAAAVPGQTIRLGISRGTLNQFIDVRLGRRMIELELE